MFMKCLDHPKGVHNLDMLSIDTNIPETDLLMTNWINFILRTLLKSFCPIADNSLNLIIFHSLIHSLSTCSKTPLNKSLRRP